MKVNKIIFYCILFFAQELIAQEILIVDLADEIRPATHCASGSLYGITEDLPVDIDALVAPLKPHMFCQPGKGEYGNQHPYGSAIAVSERIAQTTGVVQINLADLLPYWPYEWPGQEQWLAMVEEVIIEKIASGRDNYHSYYIWNEPGITWVASNGNFYTECWKPTYDLIKSLDPTMKIAGPGTAYFNITLATEFLTFCRDNNCLPDIFCWHQAGISNFVGWFQEYRQLESDLGISPLEVSINEYSSRVQDPYEGCPGFAVPIIAKFERYGVESASISWWHTQYPGRLGSILTPTNEKGGGWYLYKWYGDMEGNMVRITPPNEHSDGLDGFGAIDMNNNVASICIGGNTTGDIDVEITGIPDIWGTIVNVQIDYVSWEDKDTPVSGTTTLSTTQYNVESNTISVPVTIESNLYAYRILITPAQTISPPEITIVTPENNTGFVAPAYIPIDVLVSDIDGTIQHIDFYINDANTPFHEEWLAPYAFDWEDVPAGLYKIKAIVYDNEGYSGQDSITVRVNVPQAPYGGSPHTIPGIIQMEEFDEGGNGFAYFDVDQGTHVNPHPDIRTNEDVDIEFCIDTIGAYNLGWTNAGEWLEYTIQVDTTGLYNVVLRAACDGDNRTLSLAVDETVFAANMAIPNTGGWQNWVSVAVGEVELTAGEHILRITIGETNYINLNYITFTRIHTGPIITGITPSSENIYNTNDTLNFTVSTSAITDSITTVEFYINNILLYTDSLAPYSYNWFDMDTGTYLLKVIAYDSANITSEESASYRINPGTTTIHLEQGWNIIGFLSYQSTDVETALLDIWPYFEVLKNMEGFYIKDYVDFLQSLHVLERGDGYLIKVNSDCVLEW